MRADRLMRQRDEDEKRGAQDDAKHSQVEEEHAADVQPAQIEGTRGQERISEGDGSGGSRDGEEDPRADERPRPEAHAVFDPFRSGDDVLEEEAERQDEPRHEPPAGGVVASEEEEGRSHAGDGQHQPHEDRGYREIANGGIFRVAWVYQIGYHIGGDRALLWWQRHHFRGGPE